jgi:AcrR family transcriptional regulator
MNIKSNLSDNVNGEGEALEPEFHDKSFSLLRRQKRKSQQERSAETRRRVLDAAISCLIERGYGQTTTSEIAIRAGLTRGAQLYHFSKREKLLSKAVERLFNLRFEDLKQRLRGVAEETDRWAAFVETLWRMNNEPLFRAWVELVAASRYDSYLRRSVRAMNLRINQAFREAFKEFFAHTILAENWTEMMLFVIVFALEGMAFEGAVADRRLSDRILGFLKTMTKGFLGDASRKKFHNSASAGRPRTKRGGRAFERSEQQN